MLYLFDIDGTLIGGDGAGRRAFERACVAVLGVTNPLSHIRLDGMTDLLILDAAFEAHAGRRPTVAEADAILNEYLLHLEIEMRTARYHVKPGVEESLALLESRGAAIGLATGNLERGARIKLEPARLWHRFGFGGFGSDSPDRATLTRIGIERGLKRCGRALVRDQIFVIGDTPKDVAAAHAAGARAIGVATGGSTVEELRACGAEEVYPTLREWLATVA